MFATNSCKYCIQIATKQIIKLVVATFATRIFAMYNKKMLLCNFTYSCIPITQAGSIKGAGRIFLKIFLNEQALLSKQGGSSKRIQMTRRKYKAHFT